eukprot:scaffold39115_cov65-Phaeocystis_antarctica.AAC.5
MLDGLAQRHATVVPVGAAAAAAWPTHACAGQRAVGRVPAHEYRSRRAHFQVRCAMVAAVLGVCCRGSAASVLGCPTVFY